MIRYIIHKELLSTFKQPYIYILVSLLIVLFFVSGITTSGSYGVHSEYYNRSKGRFDGKGTISRFIGYSPHAVFFMCADSEKTSKIHLLVSLDSYSFGDSETQTRNQYLTLDYPLDWTYLIQIFFSIFGVLLAYTAFSEEIEQGTLGLICSNPVSRLQIFIGKFITYILITASVLLLCFLTGLITVLMLGKMPLPDNMLIPFLSFFALSLLYVSLFILIGMSCSLLTRHSTISLIVSVTIWLMTVIILPEGIDILVRKTQTDPSDYELAQQLRQTMDNYHQRARVIDLEVINNQPYTDEEIQKLIPIAQEKLMAVGVDRVIQSKAASDHMWFTRFSRAMELRKWKLISPSILFRDNVEKILHAGNYRFIDLFHQARQYWFRFVEDMESRYGIFDMNVARRPVYLIPMQRDSVVNLSIKPPDYQDNGMLIKFQTPTFRESLNHAASSIIALMLLAFGVGIWGFISFVKCDVRSK